MGSALHTESLIGSLRMNPVPAANAATETMSRQVLL